MDIPIPEKTISKSTSQSHAVSAQPIFIRPTSQPLQIDLHLVHEVNIHLVGHKLVSGYARHALLGARCWHKCALSLKKTEFRNQGSNDTQQ